MNNHIVALRKESVDRNEDERAYKAKLQGVALRKESVDRNITTQGDVRDGPVALRKESVDRNYWLDL